jgi:predicted O-methyltransferase YrrM
MNFFENNIIWGHTTYEELLWLYQMAKEMDSIVEVGSWKGRSTYALLHGCKGTVFAVDHFKGSPELNDLTPNAYDIFYANVGRFEHLVVMRMDSVSASRFFKEKSIDMVFIDASHDFESVVKDLSVWMPICKKVICGHDADYEPVRKALDHMKIPYGRSPDLDRMWTHWLP